MDIGTEVHDRQKESMNLMTDFERAIFFSTLDSFETHGGAADIRELYVKYWKSKGIDPYA